MSDHSAPVAVLHVAIKHRAQFTFCHTVGGCSTAICACFSASIAAAAWKATPGAWCLDAAWRSPGCRYGPRGSVKWPSRMHCKLKRGALQAKAESGFVRESCCAGGIWRAPDLAAPIPGSNSPACDLAPCSALQGRVFLTMRASHSSRSSRRESSPAMVLTRKRSRGRESSVGCYGDGAGESPDEVRAVRRATPNPTTEYKGVTHHVRTKRHEV